MEAAAVWEKITELQVWEDNPRKNKKAIPKVVDSIKRFGFGAPILARKADKKIIAGHTRFAAAKRLGLDRVPVRYLDLDPADSRLLALADNKISEVADWDDEKLSQLIKELEISPESLDLCGWSQEELESMFEKTFIEEDQPPDPPVTEEKREPISKFGEVYKLGQHKLICGDSTDPRTYDSLLGSYLSSSNPLVDIVWTDPPYGIDYGNGVLKKRKKIKNDALKEEELEEFLSCVFGHVSDRTKAGGVYYVAGPPDIKSLVFSKALKKHDMWRHTLVWMKNRMNFSRLDYHYQHENIYYGWKEGAHYWCGSRTEKAVLNFKRPDKSPEHPTMKPVDLVAYCIGNSSRIGDLCLDPFGGSGTTLIACEQIGRRARLVEIDPSYCDVIRSRWARYARMNNLPIDHGIEDEKK